MIIITLYDLIANCENGGPTTATVLAAPPSYFCAVSGFRMLEKLVPCKVDHSGSARRPGENWP